MNSTFDPAGFEAAIAGASDQAAATLDWAYATFGERVVIASSFSSDDVAVIALASEAAARHGLQPSVLLLDTGRLHDETLAYADAMQQRLGFHLVVRAPQAEAVEQLVASQGPLGMRRDLAARHACCDVRKVEPLARGLAGFDAWVTGLRREQAPTRRDLGRADAGGAGTLPKLNPIIDWTEADVHRALSSRALPPHPLYAKGFRSIGCAPCTRAIGPADDPRAGRWWWEQPEHRECGLHLRPDADRSA
jgi:phosphoadenosine phosphosulfate reductase